MTMHAYSQLYLAKSSRTLGNMLHDAVLEYGIDGTDFLERFIQSGIAEQFENGNPKYIAGKSGLELFLDIMEITTGARPHVDIIESYDRSDVYWVGWVLAHYQWYSNRTFRSILDVISFEDMLGLYGTLHEADITKNYEIFDAHFAMSESRLKAIRKRSHLTQDELSQKSGVAINTIRAYEQKTKDINKAQIDILSRLSNALKCDVAELLG